jgi:hypothetical protein
MLKNKLKEGDLTGLKSSNFDSSRADATLKGRHRGSKPSACCNLISLEENLLSAIALSERGLKYMMLSIINNNRLNE